MEKERSRPMVSEPLYLSQNSHACPRKSHTYAWNSCLLALEKIPCLLVFENPMLIPKKILIYKYLSFKNTYICWAIPHVFVPNLSCLSHKKILIYKYLSSKNTYILAPPPTIYSSLTHNAIDISQD